MEKSKPAGPQCYHCGKPATMTLPPVDGNRTLACCARHSPFTVEPIQHPLTAQGLKTHCGPDHRIRVVFAIALDRLACSSSDNTMDGLNQIVNDEVWAGVPSLSDLFYHVIGVDADKNEILLLLDADASDVLNTMEHDEE